MKPNNFLTRREASDFLQSRGVRVAPATLAKYATTGGGPLMRKFGRNVIYEVSALVDWVDSKLTAPQRSTSDHEGE